MKTAKATSLSRSMTATALAAALCLPAAAAFAADVPADGGKSSSAQQVQLTDRETVNQYEGWNDPDMSRVAVHGGRALLRQVQAANADLAQNKLGEARRALRAADDFAQGLQLMIPYTVVVDNVRNAKHELLASTAGISVDDLLPIYASIDEMAVFAPELAGKVKSSLDEVAKHVKNGEKDQAAEKLDEVAAEMSETTVYLPVMYVENQLNAALNALDHDPANVKMAQSAVDNTLLSLEHSTVNMHYFPGEKAAGKGTSATPQSGS